MPDNPISGKAGNITRLNQMLSYFNDVRFDVTFVSLRDWGQWTEKDVLLFQDKFPNIKLELLEKKYKKRFFKYLFLYKIPNLFKQNSIDITSFILRKEFGNIAKQSQFDIAVISYASWAKLGDYFPNTTTKIIDTHDFITAQSRHKKNKIGKLFQDEMNLLRYYNNILTYSVEEEYIFEQFTDKKVTLMPISFPVKFQNHTQDFKYDVLFVASDNPHNVKGIQWFLEYVLPNLENVKIHVIGKICKVIGDYPNVVKHGLVDDLEDYYNHAKIAICPMLSGTGIKIKVLEALSYGIPVVTNRRGVDGLINKVDNGCLVADTGLDFANQIKKLLINDDFYNKTRDEAVSYFVNNHSPTKEDEILSQIFG